MTIFHLYRGWSVLLVDETVKTTDFPQVIDTHYLSHSMGITLAIHKGIMQIAVIRMCYKQYDEKFVVLQRKTETKMIKNI